jgi:nicotinate phosphoribosyltransferase
MVYKLVEVDHVAVEKRSPDKVSHGGRKSATRLARPSGTVTEEVVHPFGAAHFDEPSRVLTIPLMRAGAVASPADLHAARELVARGLGSLPWEGLALSAGEPAIPTRRVAPR